MFSNLVKRFLLTKYNNNRVFISNNLFTIKNLYQEFKISIDDPKVITYLDNLKQEFYNEKCKTNINENPATDKNNTSNSRMSEEINFNRIRKLSKLINAYEQRNVVIMNLKSLKDLDNEKDEDMKDLIKEEKQVYSNIINQLESSILEELLNLDEADVCNSLLLEVNAGVGGQEAMLFASELFEMYSNYINYKNWDYEKLNADYSDIGGLRHGSIVVNDIEAFQHLKHEAGVHRVQRVPATEKSGRMHTSTVSVAVIPRTDEINIILNEKDLRIETKRASGAGGQHVNTTDSAVRITHVPTGEVVEVQEDRSQIKNREIALKRLKMKLWEKEYKIQEANKYATRKSQVGSSMRNEKIRTYNFTQDRITDHRIKNGTFKNLKGFLNGEEPLDYLIKQLSKAERTENLLKLISETLQKN